MEFEILDILNKNGYEAYIVGGYVRDYYLNKINNDIDITTSARVEDLEKLFAVIDKNYGSAKIKYKDKIYQITTFRKEYFSVKHRYPKKVIFTKSIKKDLKRRDFTINALLITKDLNLFDYVGGIKDLNDKCIRMIGNPKVRLKQDVLRILRAIRFATILNFTLDKKLEYYITKYAHLVSFLSYDRKKEELNKIFSSSNARYGINLIKKFKLDKYLEINLDNVKSTSNVYQIWAQINYSPNYNFSKKELNEIKKYK